MEQVNIHQAKTHLSRLADRAHEGETIIIAKGGKPWAKLVPVFKNETYAQPEGNGAEFGEPGLSYQGWHGYQQGMSKPAEKAIRKKRELGTLADRDWYLAPDWDDMSYLIEMMTNITPDDPLWEFSTDNPKNKK